MPRGGPSDGEWCLHPEIALQIWSLFGKVEVDVFASKEVLLNPTPHWGQMHLALRLSSFTSDCCVYQKGEGEETNSPPGRLRLPLSGTGMEITHVERKSLAILPIKRGDIPGMRRNLGLAHSLGASPGLSTEKDMLSSSGLSTCVIQSIQCTSK